LPLQITEFDVDRGAFDFQTQADFTEDFFLTVFAHPRVAGTVSWGFWENAHWRSDEGAHWYDRDWQALPNADIWIDLVRRHWWSHSDGSTRADGTYRTMVFDGTHTIATIVGGSVFETTVTVDAATGRHQLEVNFPPELQHLRTAHVVERMSAVLDQNVLLVTDRDHQPEQVYFDVLAPPTAGSLWLNGAQLSVGDTFTQADIINGKLRYHHVGLAECPDFDSFQLAARDAGGQVIDGGVLHIGLQVDTAYPWHNHPLPWDVDNDGHVAPIDALLVINSLNRHGAGPLDGDRPRPLAAPFYDTSRDDYVSSLDALLIINWLNRNTGEGELDIVSAMAVRAAEPCRDDLMVWLESGASLLNVGLDATGGQPDGQQVEK
jgi:hypothetical protein